MVGCSRRGGRRGEVCETALAGGLPSEVGRSRLSVTRPRPTVTRASTRDAAPGDPPPARVESSGRGSQRRRSSVRRVVVEPEADDAGVPTGSDGPVHPHGRARCGPGSSGAPPVREGVVLSGNVVALFELAVSSLVSEFRGFLVKLFGDGHGVERVGRARASQLLRSLPRRRVDRRSRGEVGRLVLEVDEPHRGGVDEGHRGRGRNERRRERHAIRCADRWSRRHGRGRSVERCVRQRLRGQG